MPSPLAHALAGLARPRGLVARPRGARRPLAAGRDGGRGARARPRPRVQVRRRAQPPQRRDALDRLRAPRRGRRGARLPLATLARARSRRRSPSSSPGRATSSSTSSTSTRTRRSASWRCGRSRRRTGSPRPTLPRHRAYTYVGDGAPQRRGGGLGVRGPGAASPGLLAVQVATAGRAFMARGFESKSVADQQESAQAEPPPPRQGGRPRACRPPEAARALAGRRDAPARGRRAPRDTRRCSAARSRPSTPRSQSLS